MTKPATFPIESLDDAVAAFMDGARTYHRGIYLRNNDMCDRSLTRNRQALRYIDEHSDNSRDILIPLLQHEDPSVRVAAANALIKMREDLALPVLEDICTNCVEEAYKTAASILVFKETFGEYNGGCCSVDPLFQRSTGSEVVSPVGRHGGEDA